jgi:glycosyltransferase involved in cell wall biosynthesis
MKVTISVAGRWRAFRLAEQLQRRGCLASVITSYPFGALKAERVDRHAIVSLPIVEVVGRGISHLPFLGRRLPGGGYWKMALFDALAQHHVNGCDIFVGWAGFALRSLREAKARGALALVERESSHILYSEALLREEYEACGLRYAGTDPRIVEMFLREYMEADYVVVPSEFAYQSFTSLGFDEARLVKIPSGVDPAKFRQIVKEDSTFRIIFVGGLTLRKGVHHLLKALSLLRLPSVELVLIGSLSKDIEPYLRRCDERVRYLGTVPNSELYKHYSQASVFVLPSLEEGMAYVIAEAMACGLPVVISTNTGGSDIVRDGVEGFIVPIRDPEAIAQRLLCLYEDRERCRAMGEAAKARVVDFTWDRYGERAIAAYGRILASQAEPN